MLIKNLDELKQRYTESTDDKEKKHFKNVLDAYIYYCEEEDHTSTVDFNDFFESCREDLDELIGDDDVQKVIDLTDLYIEHFGFYQSDEFEHELMPIFLKSIECLIAMVIDYGGFY